VASSPLFHMDSGLRARNSTGYYSKKIGQGLFSKVAYTNGELIAIFNPEVISASEGLRRTQLGLGGYMIKISKSQVLDCRPNFVRGKCMASFANSPKRCFDTATGRLAIKNANLTVGLLSSGVWRAKLTAFGKINPSREIMYSYQSEYKFYLNQQQCT
jgi:hypothetical protein